MIKMIYKRIKCGKDHCEVYINMPPKSKYTVKIKIIAVKKAKPKIDKGDD